jgi:hypothetical protein
MSCNGCNIHSGPTPRGRAGSDAASAVLAKRGSIKASEDTCFLPILNMERAIGAGHSKMPEMPHRHSFRVQWPVRNRLSYFQLSLRTGNSSQQPGRVDNVFFQHLSRQIISVSLRLLRSKLSLCLSTSQPIGQTPYRTTAAAESGPIWRKCLI